MGWLQIVDMNILGELCIHSRIVKELNEDLHKILFVCVAAKFRKKLKLHCSLTLFNGLSLIV